MDMKYELSLKTFEASKPFNTLLGRYIAKIRKKLKPFSEDITALTIIIKKHKKNHFFSGRFSLQLPIKQLNAISGGNSSEKVLSDGVERLLKEYEIYKGKHFKGSSKYNRRESMRMPENMLNN
jgi:hypothetical protein